jgi:hypothetical protein
VLPKIDKELSMRILLVLACLLPTILGPSYAAEEPNPETIADIRCLAVGLRISQLPDASQKSAGMMATLYYVGRLDGRTPKLDMETLISQEIPKLNDATFRAEAVRCGNGLTARGQQLTEMGEHLIKRGQAMQQPAP